jgi:hypothetical protein
MDLRRAVAVLVLAGASLAAPPAAAAATSECALLSPEVRAGSVYAGYSESRMCAAGLKPLWQGLPEGAVQVMRFTFSSGHALFWRSVTITALPDGSGRMEVVGGGHKRRDARSSWVAIRSVRRRLSAEALTALTTLAEQSGTFDHAVGTWDQRANGEGEMFLHCQTLEMERADAAGYRFSSVNLGCNRPAKLMPLVNEVIRLADIGMVRGNWSAYQ